MNLRFSFRDNRQFLLNILLTTGFGAIISFLNYLFNIYLARNFSEYNFNLYNAAIGILYLIIIPATAIQAVITKKVAENRDVSLSHFKKRSLLQFTLLALFLSALFFVFRNQISQVANLPVEYMIPLTIALFSAVLSPISKGFLLGLEKIFVFNLVLFAETVLKFAMGIVAVQMNLDITLPILANCIPALLSMLAVLPFVRSDSKVLPAKTLAIDYKNLSLVFVTFFLINTPYTLDLILVNPDNRAAYGALSLLGKIVYFASITIASVMFSKLANQKDEERKKTLYISLLFTLATGLAISFVYYLFNTQVVDTVFGGLYTEISPLITVYGFAMSVYAVSYMVVNYFLVKNSFSHIFFLVLLTLLQIILFKFNNATLEGALNNQLVIYILLAVFIIVRLVLNRFKNGRKKKYQEKDN